MDEESKFNVRKKDGEQNLIKAIVFDLFETLVTHYKQPLYFGEQIAEDIGIPNEDFQRIGSASEEDRTIGKRTLETVLTEILEENHIYSKEKLNYIVSKRIAIKQECFDDLDINIIPMLEELKRKNIKIALISNCFSEEVEVIRQSVLYPYFDKAYLSFEIGRKKPDLEIFRQCCLDLSVAAEECLYVGDGGSEELEAASEVGMKAVQAGWYLEHSGQLDKKRKTDYPLIKTPMDVIEVCLAGGYCGYQKRSCNNR